MIRYFITHKLWLPAAHIWVKAFALRRDGKPGVCGSRETAERVRRKLIERNPDWHEVEIIKRVKETGNG